MPEFPAGFHAAYNLYEGKGEDRGMRVKINRVPKVRDLEDLERKTECMTKREERLGR
jgi:hypothetical protein